MKSDTLLLSRNTRYHKADGNKNCNFLQADTVSFQIQIIYFWKYNRGEEVE